MKKVILLTIPAIFILLAGCANDQYSTEKQFYQVQKQAVKIFKNPEATPPNELGKVVMLLKNFANKHPSSSLSLEAQFNIARLYIVKKEYERARLQLKDMLEQYSKSEPICSEVLFLMGNSYEIEDKWNPALEEYQKMVQRYPLSLRGLSTPVYIAQHYKIKYQPDKMIEAFKEAVKHYKALIVKYPDSGLAYTLHKLVAQCYIETKDWQSALDTFSTILEEYKGEKYKNKVNLDIILMNMANIYVQYLKDNVKARELLERVIKDYPKSRSAKIASDWLKLLLRD